MTPILLNVKQLADATGLSRSMIHAMKKGYIDERGQRVQFTFTHGRWTMVQPFLDWLAEHPDFRFARAYKRKGKK